MNIPWNKRPDWWVENKTYSVDDLPLILAKAEIKGLRYSFDKMVEFYTKKNKPGKDSEGK